ncbi:Putative two-component response regulator and GGDEF family protein YeaJ [Thioalkalivibrio nitratireducens DSM 14787]|uniref:diguanylate cyclase n=1 Tax=Thioalkalivibrio nitratireducens (strain DSM 14787 / UNIQEM 213 / ALEN2) TaxID=1255043 RepID=L0DTC1_THIND|nr:diguanylate cyclase [Thioalkalivibrio nitratireducens]AGA32242.1 Putative two-component response regulator and GGDEF family protein YeaJ [Thioalkalivibrio nitratireducens DSM 14787]
MPGNKVYLITVLTLMLLAGFIATTLISYFAAARTLSSQVAEETLPLTSDNIYSEIQRDLLTPVLISSLMARDTFVRDWVLDGEGEVAPMLRYLQEIMDEYRTITAFFVSDRTFRYYHPSGVLKEVSPEDPVDSWYFRVRESRAPYEINVDTDTADRSRLSIFVNYRVLDYEGRLLGVTGVGLGVDAVVRTIEAYQRRYGRTIYFVDREGHVTLHGSDYSGARRIQDARGLGQRALQVLTSPSASITYERHDGRLVYANSRLVPEFGWYLMVEQDTVRGIRTIETSLLINILLALAVTALVLFGAYLTLSRYQQRLEQMATTDRLSGAANRQVFDIVFEHIAATLQRDPRPVSVILLDIDLFKEVNDSFGHPGGDVVIRQLVELIHRCVREEDTVCRWGGEEFLVLLDRCPAERARAVAEGIREAVKREPTVFGRDRIAITISAGVAELLPGEGATGIIGRADAALYRAKREGRDRVYLAEGAAPVAASVPGQRRYG